MVAKSSVIIVSSVWLVTCSADPNAQTTLNQSQSSSDTPVSKQLGVFTTVNNPSSDAKEDPLQLPPKEQGTPNLKPSNLSQNTPNSAAPTGEANQPSGPMPPLTNAEGMQGASLPNVEIDSDTAQTPGRSLTTPAGGVPRTFAATYKFDYAPLPGSTEGFLTCSVVREAKMRVFYPEDFSCRYKDKNGQNLALPLTDFYWKFTLTNCPDAAFLWAMRGEPCSLDAPDSCVPVIPETQLKINDVDLDGCVARKSQLIFTVIDRKTQAATVQTFNLTKISHR